MSLRAPFPWFGGKSRVAHLVWDRFGDVPNYVEPFAGSLAVLLSRPTEPRVETVNDVDCYLSNFWRAVQRDDQAYLDEAGPLFAQMEQFAAAAAKVAREPELRDFWRIRARLRGRRFDYGPEWAPVEDMRRAFKLGWTIADMDHAAGEAEDYDHFRRLIGYE